MPTYVYNLPITETHKENKERVEQTTCLLWKHGSLLSFLYYLSLLNVHLSNCVVLFNHPLIDFLTYET
jgi:hypothetical protein